MTSIAEDAINTIVQDAPNAPAAQLAEAAAETVENPTPGSILADIETIISVYHEIKIKLAGVHPTVAAILKALL